MKTTDLNLKTITSTNSEVNYYQFEDYSPDIIKLEETNIRTTIIKNGNKETTIKKSSKLVTTKEIQKKYGNPYLIKPEFLNYIKTHNPFMISNLVKFDFKDFIINLDNHENNFEYVILFLDASSHSLWNVDLNPVSYCIDCGYIDTSFTDEYINLDLDFISFLKNHPWVVNKNNLTISDVPRYYESDPTTQYIPVSLYCSDEELKIVYDEAFDGKRPTNFNKLRALTSLSYISNKNKLTDWFGIAPFLK